MSSHLFIPFCHFKQTFTEQDVKCFTKNPNNLAPLCQFIKTEPLIMGKTENGDYPRLETHFISAVKFLFNLMLIHSCFFLKLVITLSRYTFYFLGEMTMIFK